ncbi:MAG: nicotinate phosphoribosyltransferase [Desulfurococcales archaeon]|nr:nicotinate phosphoribosyltransferase [Desulfurococcales archaeon]
MVDKKIMIPTEEEIKKGLVTDIYFYRTKRILEESGLSDVRVRMEVHSYKLPSNYKWAVFAGLSETISILENKDLTVYAIPEGTFYKEKEPLMIIEGKYVDMAMFETAILGILRHATSVATKSSRIKKLAGNKTVLFFGLRSSHPAISLVLDKYSYLGGLDAVSGLLAEKYLGLKPKGTMPHALIIVFGNQVEAWKWYAKIYGQDSPIIALVDTFMDERYESLLAARELGEKLGGVRLDTPGSRRGRMRDIVEEVRWTLDINGYKNVNIIVSGGINEADITELRDVVDGFGVGTSIAWPKNVDISMDIVEVDRGNGWEKITKRGKLPGAKALYRCLGMHDHITLLDEEPPEKCPDGSKPVKMTRKIMENGRLLEELPGLVETREYVLKQLEETDI